MKSIMGARPTLYFQQLAYQQTDRLATNTHLLYYLQNNQAW